MPKVTFGGASGLDALITGPGEATGWIRHSKDIGQLSVSEIQRS